MPSKFVCFECRIHTHILCSFSLCDCSLNMYIYSIFSCFTQSMVIIIIIIIIIVIGRISVSLAVWYILKSWKSPLVMLCDFLYDTSSVQWGSIIVEVLELCVNWFLCFTNSWMFLNIFQFTLSGPCCGARYMSLPWNLSVPIILPRGCWKKSYKIYYLS
jgi:hypothetical protein